MADRIVVMPGSGWLEHPGLRSVAGEFGWVVEVAPELREVTEERTSAKTVAVLFHRDAFGPGYGWPEAIRLLRLALPGAHVVPCYGFSESIDWIELVRCRRIHSLRLPLKDSEVRQSLGFVWQAEKRLASRAQRVARAAGQGPNVT